MTDYTTLYTTIYKELYGIVFPTSYYNTDNPLKFISNFYLQYSDYFTTVRYYKDRLELCKKAAFRLALDSIQDTQDIPDSFVLKDMWDIQVYDNIGKYIIPVRYSGYNRYGDFEWMINNSEYNDALFIFNDNDEDHYTDISGGGNAAIRPYNRYSSLEIPRSAGISTGSLVNSGGYKTLDNETKCKIDSNIDEIKDLIKLHKYKRIFYSEDQKVPIILGTSIFRVDPDVLVYITERIHLLNNDIVCSLREE